MYLRTAISSFVRVKLSVIANQRRAPFAEVYRRDAEAKEAGTCRVEESGAAVDVVMGSEGDEVAFTGVRCATGDGNRDVASAASCCKFSGTHLGIPNTAGRETGTVEDNPMAPLSHDG